ncbi:MAG: branched-chain amino acid ABC transporter substrate-binding protein [Ktedonobacterales bacterium]
MQHQRLLRALPATLAIGALVALGLNGCGAGSTSVNKALKISTEFPVSGGDAADTVPAQNGVDLAVQQNANLGNGYTLSVVHKDDEGANGADPTIGATNVQALIGDSSVMAIVGPFNSGVAAAEIPLVNSAGIVEISPTNTNPGLTISQYAPQYSINFAKLHPAGKAEYYFRVCANDVGQGKADALIALSPQVHAKSVFIVDDNTAYGKGLADFFTANFTGGGGKVVGTRTSISQAQVANLGSLATTIKNANPDVVFYGGVTSQGGAALKLDLVSIGYQGYMIGGDGIADDPGFITTAGKAAIGTIGTVAAPDTSALKSSAATAFVQAYTAAFPGKPLLPYSAQAYDAAMIEITAIKNLISSGKTVTRAAIREQVAGLSYTGVTGTISFDPNGDNSGSKVFSVYAVDQTGKWVFQQEVNA